MSISLKSLVPRTKVVIFDFDNTLCVTDSRVIVTLKDGSKIRVRGDEFDENKDQYESYSLSEFASDELNNPRPIIKNINKLRRSLSKDSGHTHRTMVLTARGHIDPIQKWLKTLGIGPIYIVGLDDASSKSKAKWIEENMVEENMDIVFYDDREDYLQPVNDITRRHPTLTVKTVHVKDRPNG